MRFTKEVPGEDASFKKLPAQVILQSARVIDPASGVDAVMDIYIRDGVVESMEKIDTTGFEGELLDLSGKVVTPGWMDMHVHLREPGREDEETIQSGALAAANGGFTAVCCMPDTSPTMDTQEIIQYIKDRARASVVDVHPIAAITKDREGQELAEILELVEQGAVAISDDTNAVMSAEIMRRALEYSRMVDIPVISIAEDQSLCSGGQMHEGYASTCLGLGGLPSVAEEIMIARDIMLAEYTGARLHIGHITSQRGIDLVRQARERGIRVTAEATPHHMSLTDESLRSFDTNLKVRPPLRTEADREAILQGLSDGVIDAIATDHQPHSWEEKAAEFMHAPFGIAGLETAMGISMQALVAAKRMALTDLVRCFTVNPAQILNLPVPGIRKGEPANLTLLDPTATWTFDSSRCLSRSTNTPFEGREMQGRPLAVIHRGQILHSTL